LFIGAKGAPSLSSVALRVCRDESAAHTGGSAMAEWKRLKNLSNRGF